MKLNLFLRLIILILGIAVVYLLVNDTPQEDTNNQTQFTPPEDIVNTLVYDHEGFFDIYLLKAQECGGCNWIQRTALIFDPVAGETEVLNLNKNLEIIFEKGIFDVSLQSPDRSKLAMVSHEYDEEAGAWKQEIWIYDFATQSEELFLDIPLGQTVIEVGAAASLISETIYWNGSELVVAPVENK